MAPQASKPSGVLIAMLSRSLGTEKAQETIEEASRVLGCGPLYSLDDALRVLEHIAASPGIVGVTARFAKSRAHLIWSFQDPPGAA